MQTNLADVPLLTAEMARRRLKTAGLMPGCECDQCTFYRALEPIAAGASFCKLTAAEEADRARIAQLETEKSEGKWHVDKAVAREESYLRREKQEATDACARMAAQVVRYQAALKLIASCESRIIGDVVDIARQALSGASENG